MSNEQELLTELKKGSPKAFELLYKQHFVMIASLISRMGGKQQDIEDVFQETLFILVKKIRDPEFELTAKIGTFLHAIARNNWLKKTRKGTKEMSMVMEDIQKYSIADDGQTDVYEKELIIGVILDKINTLEKDCQEVIKMTFFKKMSHAEVAEILGYSLSFIKVKKFRCLGYLRKMVTDSPFLQM